MAHINSPSNPSATMEVDQVPQAGRVILYDQYGHPVTSVLNANETNAYYPDTQQIVGTTALQTDASGSLQTRSAVLTDEGAFSDCFVGTNIYSNLTGVITFIAASTVVTAVGGQFQTELKTGQYIRLNIDDETAYAQISTITDNNNLTLTSGYAGSSAGGLAVVSNWKTDTGAGSITVSQSHLSLSGGVNPGSNTYVARLVDYAPIQMTFIGAYNAAKGGVQMMYFGFQDDPDTPVQQVVVQFDPGLPRNQVRLVTTNAASSANTQNYICTLPVGLTVDQELLYRLSLTKFEAALTVAPSVVNNTAYQTKTLATVVAHLPRAYGELYAVIGSATTTLLTQSGSLFVDVAYLDNANRLEVATTYPGAPVDVMITGSKESGVEDMSNLPRGSSTVPSLSSDTPNYQIQRTKIAIGDYGQDRGDASQEGRGVPVENVQERQMLELQMMRGRAQETYPLYKYASERGVVDYLARTGRSGRM